MIEFLKKWVNVGNVVTAVVVLICTSAITMAWMRFTGTLNAAEEVPAMKDTLKAHELLINDLQARDRTLIDSLNAKESRAYIQYMELKSELRLLRLIDQKVDRIYREVE